MPRARSPDSIKAEELYRQGMSLVDIAKELKKPPGTVRRWKSEQGWDGVSEWSETKANVRKQGERLESKASVRKQNKRTQKEAIAEEVEQVINNPDLTDKQRLFCLYYSKSFNATSAYQRAYGVDYDTANAHGYKLLSNEVIASEIMRLKKERLNKAFLTPEDIFERYMQIAYADITNFADFGNKDIKVKTKDGDTKDMTVSYVNIKDSNQVDGTLISEVSQGREGVKVKLPDKLKALEWLTEHMDMSTAEQRARIEQIKAQTESLKGSKDENGDLIEDFISGIMDIEDSPLSSESQNKK